MQSVLLYGRLISRAIAKGIYDVSSGGPSTSSANPPTGSIALGNSSAFSQDTLARNAVQEKKFNFLTAVSGFPKNNILDKVKPGKFGDDAYFVAKHNSGEVIGVADGVGGWRAWGIDPGQFSNTLMRLCERIVLSGAFSPSDPGKIIAQAYYELLENKAHILGSSTACLVVLQGAAGRLCSANIGDSGFLVVRNGSVVHKSLEQQHYFNTPFQLSLPPPGTSEQVLSDRPESADRREFAIQAGDMLLVASDGVFDNLPLSMIVKELVKVAGTSDVSLLQEAANSIAQLARKLAFDEEYMSPFAINAQENGIDAVGGKPDDITVVVTTVTGNSS